SVCNANVNIEGLIGVAIGIIEFFFEEVIGMSLGMFNLSLSILINTLSETIGLPCKCQYKTLRVNLGNSTIGSDGQSDGFLGPLKGVEGPHENGRTVTADMERRIERCMGMEDWNSSGKCSKQMLADMKANGELIGQIPDMND